MKRHILAVNTGIFSLIAVLHALRIFFRWPAQIGSFSIPIWLSVIAVLVAGLLAYANWKLYKQ